MPAPLTFPAQQKTPLASRTGRSGNCTLIVQRIAAQALHVTTAGEAVGLHLHTSEGTVFVTVPMASFIQAARGPRDANGRYFPKHAKDRQGIDQQLAEDAEALPPPLPVPDNADGPKQRRMTPERQARIDEAARRIIANPGMQATPVAREIGEPVAYLYEALGRLRLQARPPVAKPSGKIL